MVSKWVGVNSGTGDQPLVKRIPSRMSRALFGVSSYVKWLSEARESMMLET